ncbi:MAG: hypothetical protein KJ053_14335 [Dehalococcoidia bacterium]|nr:hypothetical protein [Dehalococcoidia bacterium]
MSRSPEHRWRQFALPAAVAVSLLAVLLLPGLIQMAERQKSRMENRAPAIARTYSPGDLLMTPRADAWEGEQYAVTWLAASSASPPVLPPGVSRLPGPGEAFVSPALDRLARDEPPLAARYPRREIIGNEGILSGDELLAYVGLPADRVPSSAFRVSGFGNGFGGTRGPGFELDVPPAPKHVAAGGALFLFVPALIALIAGAGAASRTRDHRFRVLYWLGAPPSALMKLAMIETLALAAPSAIVVMVAWVALSGLIEWIPILDVHPLAGDVAVPWWLAAIEAVGAVATACAFSAMGAVLQNRTRSEGTRATVTSPALSWSRILPLSVALLALAARPLVNGGIRDGLLLLGIVTGTLGLPAALPLILRGCGHLLASGRSLLLLLAGRSLDWDPIRAARTHAAAAVLVSLVLVGIGYVAWRDGDVRAAPLESRAGISVAWPNDRPGDLERLGETLQGVALVRWRWSPDGLAAEVEAPCARLAPMARVTCDSEGPYSLDGADANIVARLLGAPPVQSVTVTLVESLPSSDGGAGQLLVLGSGDQLQLEAEVRTAAMRILPASVVRGPSEAGMSYGPSHHWTIAGMTLAALVLGLATLLATVDRRLAREREGARLRRLGMRERSIKALESIMVAVPFAAAVAAGGGMGLLLCHVLLAQAQPSAPMPWGPIARLLAVIGSAALAGGLALAVFGRGAGVGQENALND